MTYKYSKKEMTDFISRVNSLRRYDLAKTYIETYAGKTFSKSYEANLLKGLENVLNNVMLMQGGMANA